MNSMLNMATLFKILICCFILFEAAGLVKSFDNDQTSAKHKADGLSTSTGPIKKASVLGEKKFDAKHLMKSQPLPIKSSPSLPLVSAISPSASPFEESDIPSKIDDSIMDEKNFTDQYVNLTNQQIHVSNHSYYHAIFYPDPKMAMNFWINMSTLTDSSVHDILSDSHRRAAPISLPFNFSFYGNNLTKITIATGGFLYMGEYVHSWLAATQYIAPLMANFDTRNSSKARILYGYNSTVFVVQWDNVMLQEQRELEFTFQCSLYSNGDIAFVYKHIPITADSIPDTQHPVKVGLSDAYFIQRQQIFVKRKTIYEYHKIDLLKENYTISNQTAIFLEALPTCYSLTSCSSCLRANLPFECVWCESLNRCSDGYERGRQEWITYRCDHHNVQDLDKCSANNVTVDTNPSTDNHRPINASTATNNQHTSPTTFHNGNGNANPVSTFNEHHSQTDHSIEIDTGRNNSKPNVEYNTQEQLKQSIDKKRTSISAAHSSLAISLFFFLSIVAGLSLWTFYAYRNPTSTSGQLLIRWRPSKWRWNGAETRYTAASIHM